MLSSVVGSLCRQTIWRRPISSQDPTRTWPVAKRAWTEQSTSGSTRARTDGGSLTPGTRVVNIVSHIEAGCNWRQFREPSYRFERLSTYIRTYISLFRNNASLEKGFNDQTSLELTIVGYVYVMDFDEMIQYRKDRGPMHRRKLKRDSIDATCKGVAGMVAKT